MNKALVLGFVGDAISSAQQEPFRYSQKQVKNLAGVTVKYQPIQSFAEAVETCKKDESDAYFLMPFWNEDPKLVAEAVHEIRAIKPDQSIIFIDPFAQTSSRFFSILPDVNYFLKRQSYRNLSDYCQPIMGGMQLTHYLAETQGYDLMGWHVGSEVPKGYEHRIIPGWNLGTAKKFKHLLLRPRYFPQPAKQFDIFCRMSLGSRDKKEWYYKYRSSAVNALDPLTHDYQVKYSGGFEQGGLVSQRQYFRELRSSKLIFSPFGWGETCWRDFEAVCYGGLLIKPSMDHIDTEPNIFIPGETYVPVAWDFSDLESKCHYYLEHPEEATRIAKNAQEVYRAYFKNNEFAKKIKHLTQLDTALKGAASYASR